MTKTITIKIKNKSENLEGVIKNTVRLYREEVESFTIIEEEAKKWEHHDSENQDDARCVKKNGDRIVWITSAGIRRTTMNGLNIIKKPKKALVQNSAGIATDTEATHQSKPKTISSRNADPKIKL
jgi:hypothetical protein